MMLMDVLTPHFLLFIRWSWLYNFFGLSVWLACWLVGSHQTLTFYIYFLLYSSQTTSSTEPSKLHIFITSSSHVMNLLSSFSLTLLIRYHHHHMHVNVKFHLFIRTHIWAKWVNFFPSFSFNNVNIGMYIADINIITCLLWAKRKMKMKKSC